MIWETAGGVIVAGSVAQIALLTWRNAVRVRGESRKNDVDLQLLQTELEMMRDLRQKRSETALPWNGFRKFLVTRKVMESKDVCSFYLAPHDKKRLPGFLPGQYLTFQLDIAGSARPVIRCYSLSDGPSVDGYRVSIKRVPSADQVLPPGMVSSHFHDKVEEGDILDVKAPSGKFSLDPEVAANVVLIGGGIGVTPVFAMLKTLISLGSTREIWFFYGLRNHAEHVMKEQLDIIAREHPNVHLHVCYSKPETSDELGRDYHHEGRVSVELFKKLLPSSNYDYYICGPGPLMQSMTEGLKEWGVPEKNIHFETFGPSSVKKVAPTMAPEAVDQPGFAVEFKKSCKTVRWTGGTGNLLELAEANGISIPSGCRAGSCGTCRVAVFSGEVAYLDESDFETDPGTRLTCIGSPKTDLVLDA